MSLLARVMGIEQPKISPHVIYVCLKQHKAGNMTAQEVRNAMDLTPAEAQELLAMRNAALLNLNELWEILLLAELRIVPFETEAKIRARLGI